MLKVHVTILQSLLEQCGSKRYYVMAAAGVGSR